MKDIAEFKNLKFPGTNRLISEFHYIKVYGDTRIYYRPNDPNEKLGFDFYVTEFYTVEWDYTQYEDQYKAPGFQATCLFWGHAYWDGLRHLFMGDKETDTENYLYYPNTLDLACVFKKIRELENTFCNKDQLEDESV